MDDVREKIGALSAKAEAAHSRVDKIEREIRDDLKELKDDLKELNAYMHRAKGATAILVFLSGVSGAGLIKLIEIIKPT